MLLCLLLTRDPSAFGAKEIRNRKVVVFVLKDKRGSLKGSLQGTSSIGKSLGWELRQVPSEAGFSCAQLHEANILFSFINRQLTFLFSSIIRSYSSLNLLSQSLFFFRRMLLAYKPFDRHTLPVVLKSCAGLSAMRFGQQVHGAVLVNGFSLDLGNLNT
ncbi:hypothetical protein RJT34_31710 [Clitoria ternatea]|uniref:Uncharacterized protein n=1 Tax=Clitoria ternatea TaxID=43366 RepID=A0AAN9EWW9_CLITE